MSELDKLIKQARKHYIAAQDFDDMSCGRHLAEQIRPSIYIARQKFNELYKRIKELNPDAPNNPLPNG